VVGGGAGRVRNDLLKILEEAAKGEAADVIFTTSMGFIRRQLAVTSPTSTFLISLLHAFISN
jgi:hypothetical protein